MARQGFALDTRPYGSRTRTDPVPVVKTQRRLDVRNLTSLPAGKMVPLAAWPLLREDRLSMSRFRINFEMMETAELLINAVNVRVIAYLVPFLAFERFDGMDALNRAYMKELATGASTLVPFFTTFTAGAHGSNEIHKRLGKHCRPGKTCNAGYIEAYNTIWNFRAANRSPDITPRALTDQTLAKAFWLHNQFAHIVPDFDQAVIEGEVPLTITPGVKHMVYGLGTVGTSTAAQSIGIKQTDGSTFSGPGWLGTDVTTPPAGQMRFGVAQGQVGFPAVWTELAETGVTVSLANIELARRTQAFAALRKQYTGLNDDYIIDLLMSGISVPEQFWMQPQLLADKHTIFGMAKRYASDSTDLTASVVNGATFIDLAITTPVVPTGGIVMIVAEITPEQLFERQQDPFLDTTDPEQLPEFLRDTLDPEKVEVVPNEYVDNDHDTPQGVFGYAPLNFRWNANAPGIGGKFFRPEVDAPTDEDRQRIWAVETQNPTLSEDFYLCTNMHTKPFVVTNQDPFEAVTRGLIQITGNTVFGRLLIEASDDYNVVMGEAPIDRIDKPEGTTETEETDEPASA